MPYEEEDTCIRARELRVAALSHTHAYIYEEEDTCHMRRRMHACTPLSYHIQAHTHKIPWPWRELTQRPPPPPAPPLQQQRPFALPPPPAHVSPLLQPWPWQEQEQERRSVSGVHVI